MSKIKKIVVLFPVIVTTGYATFVAAQNRAGRELKNVASIYGKFPVLGAESTLMPRGR